MELDYKAIGKRIKIARIKADLTQEAYQLVRENSITKIGTALAEIYDSLFEEGTYENINYNRLV